MTRIVVVRPEPGNTATATRARALGFEVRQLPFFAIAPVTWDAPGSAAFDALIVTSANAIRHGGAALGALKSLPVIAVGDATASAARRAGFTVAAAGSTDAASAATLAAAHGFTRPLHLAGRDHVSLPGVATRVVYTSDPGTLPPEALAEFGSSTVLLHSSRAAHRLAALLPNEQRRNVAIATLSPAIAEAAGGGWRRVLIAPRPTDDALLALLVAATD